MEGHCREPHKIVLDVTKQNQQIGNVLTTELCVEGQVIQSKTCTLEPSLTLISIILLKHNIHEEHEQTAL